MIRFSPLVAHFILLRNSANRSSFDTSSKFAIAAAPAGFCFSIALSNLCTTLDPFSASAFSSAVTNSLSLSLSLSSLLFLAFCANAQSKGHRTLVFTTASLSLRNHNSTYPRYSTRERSRLHQRLHGFEVHTELRFEVYNRFLKKIKLNYLLYNNLIENFGEFFPEI